MAGSKACTLLVAASFGCLSAFCCDLVAAAEQRSAAEMMHDLMYGRGAIGGLFTLNDQN